MPYAGTRIMPRRMAKRLYEAGWTHSENLMIMLAVASAESRLYTHAYHWNNPGPGSSDWGIYMLNDGNSGGGEPVIGSDGLPHPVAGGSKSLEELEAFVAMACDPVAATVRARQMYVERGFQPWAAYNGGGWQGSIEISTLGILNMWREKYGRTLL